MIAFRARRLIRRRVPLGLPQGSEPIDEKDHALFQ
jgi:hypothetical protein